MSSFMKQFISKESLEGNVVEEVQDITPEEEVELVEANAEAELVRRDIEQAVEASERVIAVQEELQAQNEVAEGIMEANGGQLPMEAAAGIEAGRRAAAIALGLDPESEEGQAIVDQPQIDAMVRGEAQPATEDDNKQKGFIATLKKIWAWVVEKSKKFWGWINKVTKIVPKKYKATIAKLKSITDEEFNAGLEKIKANDEASAKFGKVFYNGKLVAVDKLTAETAKLQVFLQTGLTAAAKDVLNTLKTTEAQAIKNAEFLAKAKEVIQKELNGAPKELYMDGKLLSITVDSNITIKKDEHVEKVGSVSRKEALDTLNVGSIMSFYAKLNDYRDITEVGTIKELNKQFEERDGGLGVQLMSLLKSGDSASKELIQIFNTTTIKITSFLDAVVAASKNQGKEEADAGQTKALPYNG